MIWMSMLRERGSIDVTCEYCLDRYAFDSIDVATLFSATPVSRSSLRH